LSYRSTANILFYTVPIFLSTHAHCAQKMCACKPLFHFPRSTAARSRATFLARSRSCGSKEIADTR